MKHPFLLGAIGYPMLEVAWRGRTHPSMSLAGGLSSAAIHRIGHMKAPLHRKAALGGLAVTGVEALCGMVWNKDHQVWDYRRLPLNWRGQVCLPYTLLWSLLSAGLICIDQPAHLFHASKKDRHNAGLS